MDPGNRTRRDDSIPYLSEVTNPADTVKRMFAAFGARDLDALMETVHPESRWTYVGANPHVSRAEFTGRPQVRRFFERILERLEITAFNTDQFVVEGDTVVVFGSESGIIKATQQPFKTLRKNQSTGVAFWLSTR